MAAKPVFISIDEDDIKALENEIIELKISLASKEGILKFLIDKKSVKNQEYSVPVSLRADDARVTTLTAVTDSVIDLSKFVLPEKNKKSSSEIIWEVVSRFGDQEFTAAMVEEVLEERKIKLDAQSPRATISSALERLRQKDKIIRTLVGRGTIPHRYTLCSGLLGNDDELVDVDRDFYNLGDDNTDLV